MGDNAANNFYNYLHHLMYTDNRTLLEAVQLYLLDNNIPFYYKQMICIQDTVNGISNRYNNEMLIYNNYINAMNNNNIDHGLPDYVVRTLNLIQDVQNIIYNNNP